MSLDSGTLFLRLAAEYLSATRDAEGPVSTRLDAATIARRFDEPLPRDGRPLAEIAARVARDIVADANHLHHPMYLGHQVSAPLPAAVWMESVTAALNQSVAVWEMSPTATMVERQLVRWMCDLAGLGAASGGTLTSGGTEATFTALLAARAALFPDAWEQGHDGRQPVILCGEHAHYAVTRAAGELGIGTRRALGIASRDFRMDPADLSSRLRGLRDAGEQVLAVVATAGSTATGSFDDLDAIADLCDEHGVWLHVDGAHGASALLSPAHRAKVRGIERARSIAWDPHKMMLLPLSAGMLLMRDSAELARAFAQRAPYLFHDGGPDLGLSSFQCSRRADALKFWVALQRYGSVGIGELYERLCGVTHALYELLRDRSDFQTVHEPEGNILCFRYVGDGTADDAALDAINRDLRERYNRSGKGWITGTALVGRRVLRVTVMNPRTTIAHARRLVEGLASHGRSLQAERT